MNQSEIVLHASGGMTLAGPDAVNLYRALTVVQGLRMYARSRMLLTRGATPAVLLGIAREYTGQTYKRGEYLKAADDVQTWADTMKAALPVTDNREAGAASKPESSL